MSGVFDDLLPENKNNKPEGVSSGVFDDLKPEDKGFTGALIDGAKSTGRAISSTYNTYTGDGQAVFDNSKEQELANEDKSQDIKNFQSDFAANTGAGTDDEVGLWGAIKGTGKAIIDNPRGAALSVVEQLPNSVPTLAAGWAGAKGGAMAGGAVGSAFGGVGAGPGALIGGAAGFVGGMFLGNTLTETGHKAQEYAADGEFTPDEQSAAMTEGAKKAGAITAVDAITFGIGGKISSTMRRTAENAVEAATRKTLIDAGVDISDTAAVSAARSSQQVAKSVSEAQQNAAKIADSLRKRAAEAGVLLTVETIGEGLGEYLGELAATGQASVSEAVLESFLSLGQSSVQSMFNFAKAREKSLTEQEWVDAANGIVPEGMAQEEMPVADGVWDEPTPEAKIDMSQMQQAGFTSQVPDSDAPEAEVLGLPAPVYDVDSKGNVITSKDHNDRLERIRRGESPDVTPIPKRSEQMGLNPDNGPLSAAAAQSVDTIAPVIDNSVDGQLLGPEARSARGFIGRDTATTYDVDPYGNVTSANGEPVQVQPSGAKQLGFQPQEQRRAPVYEVDPEGNAKPTSGEAAASLSERIDLSGVRSAEQAARPQQHSKTQPKASQEKTPEQKAESSWNSMNTFERNKASAETLGHRGVLAKNTAGKTWENLSAKDQQTLSAGLANDAGQRWDTPNQKISDRDKPVLQNRDRSSQASIEQMNAIAGKPDYFRMGFSRDFGNGAPVVEPGANISEQQLGIQDIAVTSAGRQIPVQYAVVEADQLLSSNDALGNTNQAYAAGAKDKSRAVAGNGRVAGITSAWGRGTAENYKQSMMGDKAHGVSPEVIRGMKNPVLVRVMPQDQVTNNIGDESNVSGQSTLNSVEQAKTDMRRLDLAQLDLNDNNELTTDSVLGFISSMPASEKNALLDGSSPSKQAVDRLEAAVFHQAYNSEELTRLQAEAVRGEARNIVAALLRAAPAMAKLEGAGSLDIRPLVAEAAEVAINARRSGTPLAQFIQQNDFGRNPEIMPILQMMADNLRSAQRMGEMLTNLAEMAHNESMKGAVDLLGAVEPVSTKQLMSAAFNQELNNDDDTGSTQDTGQQRGTELDDAGAERQERPEQPDTGTVETAQSEAATPAAEQRQPAEVNTAAPEKWRSNYLQAAKIAREQGIDPKQYKKLTDLVAAIDAVQNTQTEPTLELAQQTEESRAAAEREDKARIEDEKKAQAKQARDEAKAKESANDKQAIESSLDRFELGKSAEQQLSGQEDIFAGTKSDKLLSLSSSRPAPAQATTSATLLKSISDSYPALVDPVTTMLQRGRKGLKGGLVIIDSNKSSDIARVYSEKTGTPFGQSVQLLSEGGEINGFYDTKSGLTFLIGPNLDTKSAPAVLLHEVIHSQQRKGIDKRSLKLIESRQNAKPELKAFLDRVAGRMADAGEQGNALEATTYIVEQAVLEGLSGDYKNADSKFLSAIEKTLGSGVASIVRDFIKMIRQFALRNNLPLNLTADDLVQYAMASLKQAAAGKSTNKTKKGQAYSFAGEKALTADKASLKKAQGMIIKGMDAEEVRQETGWIQGADENWRFEISDDTATFVGDPRLDDYLAGKLSNLNTSDRKELNRLKLHEKNLQKEVRGAENKQTDAWDKLFDKWQEVKDTIEEMESRASEDFTTLGSVIEHQQLFEAYPDLRNVRARLAVDEGASMAGFFDRSQNLIEMTAPNKDGLMGGVLHEIQHAIQKAEGFARGGTPRAFDYKDVTNEYLGQISNELVRLLDSNQAFGDAVRAVKREWSRLVDQYPKQAKDGQPTADWDVIPQDEQAAYFKLMDATEKFDEVEQWLDIETKHRIAKRDGITLSPFEQYERLAGEVEARNVETRRHMTDKERKDFAPEATEDLPRVDQDIRFSRAPKTNTKAFKDWFGNSLVVDNQGNPMVVYRGMDNDVTQMNPNEKGVIWVTPESDYASDSHYGSKKEGSVYPLYVKAENLFDYSNEEHKKALLTAGRSPLFRQATNGHFRAIGDEQVVSALKKLGFDGFKAIEPEGQQSIGVFSSTQVKSAIGNVGTFDSANPDIRYSKSSKGDGPKNLYVAHNLSADNLQYASNLGGLAAPSLAVGNIDAGAFNSFGEITLLAEPGMLESSKVRIFDADIYTPRHPQSEYGIDHKAYKVLSDKASKLPGDLRFPSTSEVAENGAKAFIYSDGAKMLYLEEQGKAPKAKPRKAEAWIKKAAKMGLRRFQLAADPAFKKIAQAEVNRVYAALEEADPVVAERRARFYFDEGTKTISTGRLESMAGEVQTYAESSGIDEAQLRRDISSKLRTKKAETDFSAWANTQLESLVTSKKIYTGLTPSGNRKYVDYNLANIVKQMTRQLQGGEGYNYGAGSIRSRYANEMKSVEAVKSRRDQIVSAEEFAKLKDESSKKLEVTLEALKPYYRYSAEDFGYYDDASSAIAEGASGIRDAFDLDAEGQKIVDGLVSYLKKLPTEYFEAKAGRAVDLSEFSYAIVPKGTPSNVTNLLREKGVKIKRYEADNTASREQAIRDSSGILFSRRKKADNPNQGDLFAELEALSNEDPYGKTEQRSGTTEKQRELGRSALRDFFGWLKNSSRAGGNNAGAGSGEVSLLGASIYKDFQAGKPYQLVGQTIESPKDLAALAQVYRDPRFETFRAFFVDKDGKIILEQTASTRMPASVSFSDDIYMELSRSFENSGADKFYIMHNHPSGVPTPSPPDIAMTKHMGRIFGKEMAAHVVIDHNSYAVIDEDGNVTEHQDESLAGIDFSSNPEVDHASLNKQINSPDQMALVAKQVAHSDTPIVVVTKGGAVGRVGLITSMPMELLNKGNSGKQDPKFTAVIRRMIRAAGTGGKMFVVLPKSYGTKADGHKFEYGSLQWMHEFAQDVVDSDGNSVIFSRYQISIDDYAAVSIKDGRKTKHKAKMHEDTGAFDGASPSIRFSRAPKANTEAFKKMFGDTKVVDESGNPKIVYHGTAEKFEFFDENKGDGLIWMTDNKALIESGEVGAAGNGVILDLYASIKNPAGWDEYDNLMIDQMIQQGFDGIILEEEDQTTYIAFENTQVKSASENNGDFSPRDKWLRFSRTANPGSVGAEPTGQATWQTPSASKFDDFVYTLQDKHVDTKRVLESIRETGKEITDDLDVYLQETLFHGRAAKRTQDFLNKEVTPLVEYMQSAKVTMPDLEEFLHARHAEEANALIAERDSSMADGGSGMTNAEARKYMSSLNGIDRKRFENAAKMVDKIIGGTRETIVSYGLESQGTVDGWTNGFKHYIPLQREDKDGQMGIGQGFSVKGSETKGRTGSTRKVVDILANVMMQRERVIVRGEKNRVAAALLGLAKDNPMPEFWTVDKVPTHRVVDKKTGLVRNQVDPAYKNRANAVVAKVNGKEHAVLLNEDDARAMRMAEALKNLDAAQLEGLLGATATATRYFAAVNTQYNPIFGVTNFVRDIQEAMLHLQSTPLAGQQARLFKNTFTAVGAVMRAERDGRKGKGADGKWGKLWDEFQNVGGQTGFRDQFSNSADRGKEIQRALTPDGWAETGLGKFFTANGTLKAPLEVVRKKAAWMFDLLSDYNTAMENGVRLSAYETGINSGMSKGQAASLAKSLTVNFNRKGAVTQQVGALYAFFNASVQGSARLGQSLLDMDSGKPKTMRLSKLGKRIVSGGVLLGSVQTLMLAAMGFDDDEPPEFIRERNIIIPTGGKTYISIPMPLGYHVIANLGRIPTEFALGGGEDAAKHLLSLVDVMADIYNPLGSSGLSMQTIAPTVIDPLAALAENKDFAGRAIAKESFNRQTPGHTLARDTASLPATWVSQVVNYATGGTEFTRGELSPTPDQIDYLVGQLTGGVGRETTKLMKSIQATATGDDLPWHNIPLAGRFFGDADSDGAKQSAFYNNMDKVRKHAEEVKGLRASGRSGEAVEYANKHPQARLHLAARAAEKQVKDMRDRKRDLEQAGAPRKEIRALEARMIQRMEQFVELSAVRK